MPNVPGKALVYSQPIYDTIALAIGATGGTFFTVPLGGALLGVGPKTLRHTNLIQAGRLETGNELQIGAMSMTVVFPIGSAVEVPHVRAGNIRVVFGADTAFLKMPAAYFPNAASGEVVVQDGAPGPLLNDQNGVPVAQNKFFLEIPQPLHSQETIQVFLENCDPVAVLTKVQFVLWGTATRPVR